MMEIDRKTLVSCGSRWARRGRVLLAALSVVLATSVGAQALDLCLDFDGGGSWVLKRFKAPRKNRCASMQGYEPSSGSGMTGMGCTDKYGYTLTLNYTSHNPSYQAYLESATCKFGLPLPPGGKRGGCFGTYITPGGNGSFGQWATLRSCDVDIE
ncbi:MAG: hypothetical protein AB1689_21470 [Thermodesulfobacteriota bacterium]